MDLRIYGPGISGAWIEGLAASGHVSTHGVLEVHTGSADVLRVIGEAFIAAADRAAAKSQPAQQEAA